MADREEQSDRSARTGIIPVTGLTPPVAGEVVTADVIVVGAGPGGSGTARHLADRGLDVVLLEKSAFPREKVCGDGLTPRATKQLIRLGIDTSEESGWLRNYGLRIYGGTVAPFEQDWPDLAEFPGYGLVSPRAEFDNMLAAHAVAGGVRLYLETPAAGPIIDERTDRIVGVRTKAGAEFRAPFVVAADGNSSRLAIAMGLERRRDRPMGVAVRTYFKSPRSVDDYLESWLELWDGKPHESNLLPGYGWIFGMGDGTCNVGLGILSTSAAFGKTDYKDLLVRWLASTPPEWGFTPDNMIAPIQGAALPMAFNRKPAYGRGLLLVGDSAGMVNPFNGEGIAYALEAGEMAATAIAEAHYRGVGTRSAERALQGYNTALRAAFGGYFRLGTIFVKLIGNPRIMRICTRYGLPRETLMRLVMKLLANLTDKREGDWMDRLITALTRVAPSA